MDQYQSTNNNANGSVNNSQQRPNQQQKNPNVRHIPIFVEGRDETILNKHVETSSSSDTVDGTPTPSYETSSEKSLYDRLKNFPVRTSNQPEQNPKYSWWRGGGQPDEQQHPPQQQQQQPQGNQNHHHQINPEQQPNKEDSIEKIKKIQTEVLDLMVKVQNFNGIRTDREYKYLDEMLTQNLLKLDVIDSDGNDNIKFARREAIKCINKTIEALEAKAESNAANKRAAEQQHESKLSTSTAV